MGMDRRLAQRVCAPLGSYLSERLLGKVLRSRLVLLQRFVEVVLSIHLGIRSDRSEGIEATCSMREKFLIIDFIH